MDRRDVGLPVREFMFTIDQIAFLLDVTEPYLKQDLIHYEGRSVGACPKDKLLAVNIAPDSAPKPEWRIAERHLKRWMRFKGWKIYDRGYVT
jgi:hypothetical protein